MKCPHCQNSEPSTSKAFQIKDLDMQQKCYTCLRRVPVRIWKCECDLEWPECSIHVRSVLGGCANDQDQVKRVTQTAEPNIKPQRKLIRLRSYTDMFEEDVILGTGTRSLKRRLSEEEEEELILGKPRLKHLRTSMLGPKMTQKYLGWSGVA